MTSLFTPITLRSVEIPNRVWISPMCQYSAVDGIPNAWHLVHLGSRAVGGAGMIIVEATGVSAIGRISAGDVGIWSPAHVNAFRPITQFISEQGVVPAIQLAHAGRKASCLAPWAGGAPVGPKEPGGWEVLAPSAVPFNEGGPLPKEMTLEDIHTVIRQFEQAAARALDAGFRVIELHMAHGYLMHEFLSPLSNRRTDDFGGSLENRMRFPLLVAQVVRKAWPDDLPLLVRLSASDWVEGGWDLPQSIELCRRLKEIGVDLIDASSGGLVPHAKIPATPGYQVPFAEAIRVQAGIATGAVGLITEPQQAEDIVSSGKADAVLIARASLRDPYWPAHAAKALGVTLSPPPQYLRAW